MCCKAISGAPIIGQISDIGLIDTKFKLSVSVKYFRCIHNSIREYLSFSLNFTEKSIEYLRII